MKKLLISFSVLLAVLLMFQPVMAVDQSNLGDIKNTADQTLQNASQTANSTAQDVQNTLGPIQDILNAINSVVQQIKQIFQTISNISGGNQ